MAWSQGVQGQAVPRRVRTVSIAVHSMFQSRLEDRGLVGPSFLCLGAGDWGWTFTRHRPDGRAACYPTALPAAIAVQNARILAQPNSLSENLEKALANRAVIDLTNVILISRSRINYDQ